ncbi:MAG TPA: S9 family peptidase [Flavobacteriales bacterium]|nr:S9 family peptidase [Flavobacteriales bacterium]|tara:strand:- start:102724 stop:104892 length:2169 start_codon:yes stop_codon:yes gene_type:complete
MKKLFVIGLFILFNIGLHAQNKQISLEDIWKNYAFYPSYVNGGRGMNDGEHYTVIERDENRNLQIVKYSYKNPQDRTVVFSSADVKINEKPLYFSDYQFNADETKLLLATEKESIYRYSSKAHYYVVDIRTKKASKLTDGSKQMYATFSPDGKNIAFVQDNNLFIKNIKRNTINQITDDGEKNKIINGASDWVYEEELELVKAFSWSPDGKYLAYYKFDESNVKEWDMKIYGQLYPEHYTFKYPKAGEENSKVSVHIYQLEEDKTLDIRIPEAYEYIPRIKWADNTYLAIETLNRHQNDLKIILFNAAEPGKPRTIYHETNKWYIDVPKLEFLPEKHQFIISSEKSGYNHLYLYNYSGKELAAITKGNYDVTDYYGIDKKGFVYYQSAEESPLNRSVYKVKLDGSGKRKLSSQKGTNEASFNKTFSYYINYFSSAGTPYIITLNNNEGKVLRTLEENQTLKNTLAEYNVQKPEFFKVKGAEDSLNAWMIKPADFDPSKKYPLFMFVYGGPGSQTVTDSWGSMNYIWFNLLAQKGYIVVSVDNRGTGARGEKFKKMTYKQLGKYETEDQIAAAKELGKLKYIDNKRIGIFGWSYGGYMSSLCISKGADVFKTAIAVAPVTNWRYYDNIYTERYMQTPQENPDGYDLNSPINHTEKIKGNYLLVHGMADDNVHFQNTAEMIMSLTENDIQFDLMVYPNKNHGIYGGNTRLHLYRKMTDFILNNL